MRTSLLAAAFVVLPAFEASAAEPTILTASVPGTGDRTCRAFLAVPAGTTRGAPLVLGMLGTGEYSLSASWKEDPLAAAVLRAGGAWLVFDKPGIAADAAAPRGYHVTDAVYDVHTVEDLEACAAAALAWASRQPQVGATSPVVLRGHSEGSLVASRLLLRLHGRKDPVAARVSALVLSGTPAAPMREIFWNQAKARGREERYRKAIAEGDDAFVRSQAGIGVGTLRALLEVPPLGETFAALVAHRPATRIALFHGTADHGTPLPAVRALVAENRARLDAGEPALELTLRAYEAGHGLDAGAVSDLALWTLDALRPDGFLAHAEREAAGPVAVSVPDATVTAVVGRYRIDDAMVIELSREGSRLFAQATGQPRFPVFFTAGDRLVTRVAPVAIEVERTDGKVTALVLLQGGRTRCPRIEGAEAAVGGQVPAR